jgi:hypothetical protein
MTMPSSQVEKPGMEWPPPRTATGSSWSTAKRNAASTSEVLAQRATAAGCRSCMPFHTARALS